MRIAVIPDVQAKPGLDFAHLTHVGRYLAEKRPERVICLGDFCDFPSLSSYDKGHKSFEGRRYKHDIGAAHKAMDTLIEPIARAKGYAPVLDMVLGNHENRAARAVEIQAELEGLISVDDLEYPRWGWRVHPFLKVVPIEGVAFSHYLTSGVMGRPITTAAALLTKRHMSAVVGHQQGLQMATAARADGGMLTGIICGSCYMHDEDYLGPQNNTHFRGMLMLNDVRKGEFEPMPLTLRYLKRRFG